MFHRILPAFGIDPVSAGVSQLGSGLINRTWRVQSNTGGDFVLQQINQQVFKQPPYIAENIAMLGDYLADYDPEYFFTIAKKTANGADLYEIPGEGYFRMFAFVADSHTIDVVKSPEQAFEAARQFGRFTSRLKQFPVNRLKTTLPDFHNLALRWQQFELAIQHGDAVRIRESDDAVRFLKEHHSIVDTAEKISRHTAFKKRVTHHDTKISNVLFDSNNKGICVIDLDTVMPGYFISDVGDMMRTYLSPVSEEDSDYNKIDIRAEYFKAIAEGYLGEMQDHLSEEERKHLVYAGKFMIYMQAMRFLTDYFNNDVYYGATYEGQNYVRACNQIRLLQRLIEKESLLVAMIT